MGACKIQKVENTGLTLQVQFVTLIILEFQTDTATNFHRSSLIRDVDIRAMFIFINGRVLNL